MVNRCYVLNSLVYMISLINRCARKLRELTIVLPAIIQPVHTLKLRLIAHNVAMINHAVEEIVNVSSLGGTTTSIYGPNIRR
jgi:hypothetical protein